MAPELLRSASPRAAQQDVRQRRSRLHGDPSIHLIRRIAAYETRTYGGVGGEELRGSPPIPIDGQRDRRDNRQFNEWRSATGRAMIPRLGLPDFGANRRRTRQQPSPLAQETQRSKRPRIRAPNYDVYEIDRLES